MATKMASTKNDVTININCDFTILCLVGFYLLSYLLFQRSQRLQSQHQTHGMTQAYLKV